MQPTLDKRALQKQIANQEHERALRAAAAYRSKALHGLITNIEIPRNPVGRQQDRSRREFMAFDETCYHRDFVAVKCDPETELVHRVDGWEGAAIAHKAHDERLLALQQKREKIDQNMAERYRNALKGAYMDTVRISFACLLLATYALFWTL